MGIWIWIIIGFLVIGGIVALVIAGQREASSSGEDDLLASRLVEFSERGDEVASLEEIELSQPFQERVIVPILLKVGEISARFTPQHLIEDTELKIELAGNPIRMAASTFLASRFVIAGVLGGFLFIIFLFAPKSAININPYLIVPLFAIIGFFFPQLWLQGKINSRQKEIRKAMPDALDLLGMRRKRLSNALPIGIPNCISCTTRRNSSLIGGGSSLLIASIACIVE